MNKGLARGTVLLLVSMGIFCSACTAEDKTEDTSVGARAGTAVKEMQKTAQVTYDETSQKTKEALEQFDEAARKNMEEFSQHANEVLTQFQATAEEMMKRLNEEMKQFNKALKDESNKPAASTT